MTALLTIFVCAAVISLIIGVVIVMCEHTEEQGGTPTWDSGVDAPSGGVIPSDDPDWPDGFIEVMIYPNGGKINSSESPVKVKVPLGSNVPNKYELSQSPWLKDLTFEGPQGKEFAYFSWTKDGTNEGICFENPVQNVLYVIWD